MSIDRVGSSSDVESISIPEEPAQAGAPPQASSAQPEQVQAQDTVEDFSSWPSLIEDPWSRPAPMQAQTATQSTRAEPDAGAPQAAPAHAGLDCTYSQSTGRATCTDESGDTVVDVTGYSGASEGRNNPDMEDVRNIGPVPRGQYDIGRGHPGTHTGPQTLDLTPREGTDTHGRDLFRIHGDNPTHTASEGCVILPREARDAIDQAGGGRLTVTE